MSLPLVALCSAQLRSSVNLMRSIMHCSAHKQSKVLSALVRKHECAGACSVILEVDGSTIAQRVTMRGDGAATEGPLTSEVRRGPSSLVQPSVRMLPMQLLGVQQWPGCAHGALKRLEAVATGMHLPCGPRDMSGAT